MWSSTSRVMQKYVWFSTRILKSCYLGNTLSKCLKALILVRLYPNTKLYFCQILDGSTCLDTTRIFPGLVQLSFIEGFFYRYSWSNFSWYVYKGLCFSLETYKGQCIRQKGKNSSESNHELSKKKVERIDQDLRAHIYRTFIIAEKTVFFLHYRIPFLKFIYTLLLIKRFVNNIIHVLITSHCWS